MISKDSTVLSSFVGRFVNIADLSTRSGSIGGSGKDSEGIDSSVSAVRASLMWEQVS